jgi:hypothetical protein
MQSDKAKSNSGDAADQGKGEPSLAPACGFFFILLCVVLSVGLIAASYWLGSMQPQLASRALKGQLIPWVKESSLANEDRTSILERLDEIVTDLDANRLNPEQLRRLSFRLNSNPIFQWGAIEALQAQSRANTELSDTEKESIDLACDRLMRSVLEGKIAIEQISFVVQRVATTERISQRINVREENSANDLREFWRRAESVCDKLEISKDPLNKSPSQVFRIIMDDALNPPPKDAPLKLIPNASSR